MVDTFSLLPAGLLPGVATTGEVDSETVFSITAIRPYRPDDLLGKTPLWVSGICMSHDPNQMRIRKATGQDAASIASVLRLAFAEYQHLYTKEGYSATTPDVDEVRIRMTQGPVWVALNGKQVVGTSSVVPRETGLYVRGMAVLPVARGLGIGRLLLQEIESFAATNGYGRLFLSTTPFLNSAIRLYETFGFKRTDDPPHDLFGTPLFTMEKTVPSRAVPAGPGKKLLAKPRTRGSGPGCGM